MCVRRRRQAERRGLRRCTRASSCALAGPPCRQETVPSALEEGVEFLRACACVRAGVACVANNQAKDVHVLLQQWQHCGRTQQCGRPGVAQQRLLRKKGCCECSECIHLQCQDKDPAQLLMRAGTKHGHRTLRRLLQCGCWLSCVAPHRCNVACSPSLCTVHQTAPTLLL